MQQDKRKKLLVVCTGNTCRSPMAEAVLNRYLEEQGLSAGYHTHSAGVAAFDYEPAAQNAVEAAAEQGLDLSKHEAKRITLDDLAEAALVFVMSEEHRRLLVSALPEAEGKIVVMQVPDPYGRDLDTYRACFEQMRAFFDAYFEEHPLCPS